MEQTLIIGEREWTCYQMHSQISQDYLLKLKFLKVDGRQTRIFKNAASVVILSDGGGRHPINKILKEFDGLAEKGVGLVCVHYAVEVPKGAPGDMMKKWLGGYFEVFWSVNPHWTADFKTLPKHPITRGVNPFSLKDEWYYHMKFRDNMKGVTPILSALPSSG